MHALPKRCSYSCCGFGTIDSIILYVLRFHVGTAFSSDSDVVALVAKSLTVLVYCTTVDAPGAVLGGVLRGFGRQAIGGYLNLFFYYAVAMPLGLVLAFYYDYSLKGLWGGIFVAIFPLTFPSSFMFNKSTGRLWSTRPAHVKH